MNELWIAAIAAIDAELENDANNALLYKERGRLNMLLGNQAQAMEDLRKAFQLDPSLVQDFADGQFSGNIKGCH